MAASKLISTIIIIIIIIAPCFMSDAWWSIILSLQSSLHLSRSTALQTTAPKNRPLHSTLGDRPRILQPTLFHFPIIFSTFITV